MSTCSKCGIAVVVGDYIELENKDVCLACAFKKGKFHKKHISGFIERFSKNLTTGLKLIILWLFISIISFFYQYSYSSLSLNLFVGVIIFLIYIFLIIGITLLINVARIFLVYFIIIVELISLPMEITLLPTWVYLLKLSFSIFLIYYLTRSKVKKLFS